MKPEDITRSRRTLEEAAERLTDEVWRLREALQQVREEYTRSAPLEDRLKECYVIAAAALETEE